MYWVGMRLYFTAAKAGFERKAKREATAEASQARRVNLGKVLLVGNAISLCL
jgi:hypothetical protein